MSEQVEELDAIVVGGGPAGLTAALCLGRARRRVAVFDAGSPRHGVAEGVHNFLTREGLPPAELRRIAWEQMAAYPTVRGPVRGRVGTPRREGTDWVLDDANGQQWRAPAMLLATGVVDEHPDIAGYDERWGHSIHHCPFCHGWEVRDQKVAVLGAGDEVVHLSRLLKGWTDQVVVLTNGVELSGEQHEALETAGIPVCPKKVVALHGEGRTLAEIEWADGRTVARDALFVAAPQRQVELVEQLGIELNDAGYVAVDAMMKTSLPNVWAAGDMTSRLQQVVESAAQGMRAGAMIQATLTMGL